MHPSKRARMNNTNLCRRNKEETLNYDAWVEVFKYVSSKDLLSCRLVSHQWDEGVYHSLKKRDNLRIRLDGIFHRCNEFLDFLRNNPQALLPTVLRLENIIGDCAHEIITPKDEKCLALHAKNMYMSPKGYYAEYHEVIVQICHILGSRRAIKTLELDLWEEIFPSFYAGYLITILQKLSPSLEILDIDDLPRNAIVFQIHDQDLYAKAWNQWKKMNEFPLTSLKKVVLPSEVSYACSIVTQNWLKLLLSTAVNLTTFETNHKLHCTTLLQDLKDWGRLTRLKSLRLEYLNERQLDVLLETPNLSLEEIKVNTISKEVSGKSFERFFKKQRLKLKSIVLGSPEDDGTMKFKLPECPELIRLALYHCDDSLILLQDLRFSRDTPKLKSLELSSAVKNLDCKEYLSHDANMNTNGDGRPSPIPCSTLKELTVILESHPECCSYLGDIFPSVETFSLNFPTKVFLQQLWNTWENLVELNLFFDSKSTNKEISLFGFSPKWLSTSRRDTDMTKPEWWLGLKEPKPPMTKTICDLKNLQRLTIEEAPGTVGNSAFTDISVYFGFINMKNLRKLEIGKSKITPAAAKYLSENLPMMHHLDIRGKNGPGMFSAEEKQELLSYIDYYNDRAEAE